MHWTHFQCSRDQVSLCPNASDSLKQHEQSISMLCVIRFNVVMNWTTENKQRNILTAGPRQLCPLQGAVTCLLNCDCLTWLEVILENSWRHSCLTASSAFAELSNVRYKNVINNNNNKRSK